MGRMLDALQQVSTTSDDDQTLRPLSREELAAYGLHHLTEEPSLDGPPSQVEPPRVEPPELEPPQPTPFPQDELPEPATSAPPSIPCDSAPPELPRSEPVQADVVQSTPVPPEAPQYAPVATTDPSPPILPAAADSELDRLLGTAVRERQYGELADALLAKVPAGRPTALLFAPVGQWDEIAQIEADLSVAITRRTTGEVVVIDADFQRHRLGSLLGAEPDHTLQEVLTGAADWRDVVRSTRTPRLSVLSSGGDGSTSGPAGITYIGHLLDELRRHYGLIVLHAGSVGHPEVGVLARHSDAAYLMVPLGCVRRRQLRRAASVLQRAGAALSGTVLIN